jgi:hypothetical protein
MKNSSKRPPALFSLALGIGILTMTVASSGATTVTLSTNTTFSMPANRGALADGTPVCFTYASLYQDLLHPSSPTGAITFDFSMTGIANESSADLRVERQPTE